MGIDAAQFAQIQLHQGTPTLFLHGKPVFMSILRSALPAPDHYVNAACAREYARAGIHIYSLQAGAGGEPAEWCGPQPGGRGPYDFDTVAQRFNQVLAVDPQAYFMLRIQLEMPAWWSALYPEECELLSTGKRANQSFASKLWRSQFIAFLQAYCDCLQSTGLAERVIAYQPGGGTTTEWVKDSAMDSFCGDYSQPMVLYFRDWLREHYHSNQRSLRTAWGDFAVTFETAQVPPPASLMRISQPVFRSLAREQSAIDYFCAYNDLCASLAVDACRTIKAATHGVGLAGTFFGKIFELSWNSAFFGGGTASQYGAMQRSGHLALQQVLESPYVDFITSSYTYSFRGLGGEGAPMLPTESLRLHGKLHIYDDDSRTHLSEHAGIDYGRPASLSESLAVLKRNFAEVLTRGLAASWIGGLPAYAHVDPTQEPAFSDLLQRFQELGTFALQLERTPSAEIAVLIDTESFYYETVNNSLDLPAIVQQRLWGMPRIGAPVDIYLLDDFVAGKLKPYKLYIFLNTFHLVGARREALKDQLRRDGRTALWIYAPGYLAADASLANMADLTGMNFGMLDNPWGPQINLVDLDHPITRGLAQDLTWGTNSLLSPLFHIADGSVRTLANVVYSLGRCLPGLGVKEFPEWNSIYAAAPNLPAAVLRGIARYAGVHIYSDAGDVLYAAPQLLAVHTAVGGDREFHLPARVECVYDLFARQPVASRSDHFSLHLPPASTTLWYTGDASLIRELDQA